MSKSRYVGAIELRRRFPLLHGGKFVAATLVLAGCFFVPCALAAPLETYFIPLGDLPGGDYFSSAAAVSDDGLTVVGSSTAEGKVEAFIWTAKTGMVSIGGAGSNGVTYPSSVSADGSVIVGNTYASWNAYLETDPFIYTSETGFKPLSGCGCRGPRYQVSVSGDGNTIVGSKPDGGIFGYRWTAELGPISIGDLPGGNASSLALAISADGTTIVGNFDGNKAFRWNEEEGMTAIELPMRQATGASADGSAIAGTGFLNGQGVVRWTEAEGSVWLGHLPGLEQPTSHATDISADGSVIVGGSGEDFHFQAFRWTAASGMRSVQGMLADLGVDLTGWHLTQATAVSADGRVIVGSGENPNGDTEAWVAMIPPKYVPEPPTGALLVLGIAVLVYRRQLSRSLLK